MAPRNNFKHQTYRAGPPTSPHHLLQPSTPLEIESEAFRRQVAVAGDAFRKANVAAIYLIHGTLAGNDALGLVRELGRFFPAAGELLKQLEKQAVDSVAGEIGNYTQEYARLLEDSLAGNESRIPVRLFHWSSENLHIGRAEAALQLIAELESLDLPKGRRVLIWGHSHAGNVLALVSNLLTADVKIRNRFFAAGRSHYRTSRRGQVDLPLWPRMKKLLSTHNPLSMLTLDMVTFGTPIRYGWDDAGYGNLLHFVHHRPTAGLPPAETRFPPRIEEVLSAAAGDYVQQWGIAGTDFFPPIWSWRAWLAERRMRELLQKGVRRRDLFQNLKNSPRVAQSGTTLLVDYGPISESIAEHIAGHAVYTKKSWLAFHAQEIAQRFYPAA